MDAKVALVGGGLLLVGGYLFFKSRQNQSDANKTDNATADIDNPITQQALKLYNMLGVERSSLTGNYGLAIFHNIPEDKVLNLMLEITDWNGLQDKFKKLCNNEYSVAKALSDGLDEDEYQLAIKYASAKKVVTTTTATVIVYVGYVPTAKTVAANTILGAYKSETSTAYTFINAVEDDDKEVLASISKSQAKLV